MAREAGRSLRACFVRLKVEVCSEGLLRTFGDGERSTRPADAGAREGFQRPRSGRIREGCSVAKGRPRATGMPRGQVIEAWGCQTEVRCIMRNAHEEGGASF